MQLSNAKSSLAGAANTSASSSAKIRGVCRPVVAARASAGGSAPGGAPSSGQANARKLFQQHRVLLEAGLTYDQAALILQVSQQRTVFAGTRGERRVSGVSGGRVPKPPAGVCMHMPTCQNVLCMGM